MRLRGKFHSPKCAPGLDLGDVDTYFFQKKIRSEIGMCVIVMSYIENDVTVTHILISDRN